MSAKSTSRKRGGAHDDGAGNHIIVDDVFLFYGQGVKNNKMIDNIYQNVELYLIRMIYMNKKWISQ